MDGYSTPISLNFTGGIFAFVKPVCRLCVCLLIMMPGKIFAQCTILTNAVQGISYTYIQNGGTNATSLAYNPALNIYYAVIGGNTAFPLETFTTSGVSLYQTNAGFDSRGMWWNVYANQLQANGYAANGLWAFNLDGNGYALNTGTNLFAGQNQPDAQSCGAFDCSDNEILYFNNGSIYRYSAVNDNFLGSYLLTGMPVPLDDINSTSVIYTGCNGNEIGIEDYVNGQILLFNKTTGAYSGASLLPGSAVTSDLYHLAYCNNLVWLYDVSSRTWTSYSIFAGYPDGSITVNLGNDTTLCNGQTLILDAGNPGAEFLWQNGSTGQTDTVTQAGTYSVKVSNGGCFIARDTIMVNYSASRPVSLGPDTSLCNGQVLVLNATTPGGAYLWQDSSTNATYTVFSPGIYSVTVTAGGCVGIDSVSVSYAASPVINLGGDTAICNGQSITLDAGNPGAIYIWNNGATSQAITIDSTGTYSVTVTGAGNCVAEASDSVIAAAGIQLADSVVNTSCDSSNGYLGITTTAGTGPFAYIWNNGDSTAHLSGLSAGTYSVTVTSLPGCSASISAVINPSVNDSVAISSNKQIICTSDSAYLCAPPGFTSYLWNSGQTTPCIYTQYAGNYEVKVTDTDNCIVTSNRISISVYPAPSVSISVSGDTLSCFNDSTCQWYFNGQILPGDTLNTFVATETGNYVVLISDANGCFASSNPIYLTIDGIGAVSFGGQVNVYPNPVSAGHLFVQLNNNQPEVECRIYDAAARMVFRTVLNQPDNEIYPQLEAGVYVMQLVSGTSTYILKILKL